MTLENFDILAQARNHLALVEAQQVPQAPEMPQSTITPPTKAELLKDQGEWAMKGAMVGGFVGFAGGLTYGVFEIISTGDLSRLVITTAIYGPLGAQGL